MVELAASPLAKQSPKRPPSSAARFFSKASRVGFGCGNIRNPGALLGFLHVGRGLKDRRHDRPGEGIGLLSSVDRQGFKMFGFVHEARNAWDFRATQRPFSSMLDPCVNDSLRSVSR